MEELSKRSEELPSSSSDSSESEYTNTSSSSSTASSESNGSSSSSKSKGKNGSSSGVSITKGKYPPKHVLKRLQVVVTPYKRTILLLASKQAKFEVEKWIQNMNAPQHK